MTPSYLTTTILKLRYAATGNKIDDFAAIQAATASDIDAAMGQSIFMPGDLKATAAIAAPAGWLACDGSAVSRVGYANLYAAIGTGYGAGDGSTTFNVPDFRGRTIVGAGTGVSLTARARGATGGEEAHTLATAEIPAHSHSLPNVPSSTAVWVSYNMAAGTFQAPESIGSIGNATATGNSTGGGGAHNTMPPFGVATMLIKT